MVSKTFNIISLPLKGIVGSTFRKKWTIKVMILSKSIIGSHCKELGFTWLFYFDFAEKCVTFGQGCYSKLLFPCVRENPGFTIIYTDSMYG